MFLWFLTILACSQSPAEAIQAYRDALASIEQDASNAAATCATLIDPQLNVDCLIAGAEALAGSSPDKADLLCEQISPTLNDGISRDECLFQVAERSKDPMRCAKAGRFIDPCRMHIWGSQVPTLSGTTWAKREQSAQQDIVKYGLSETDERPWIALYRWMLSQEHPLTRVECEHAAQRTACMKAGESLLQDRLNRTVGLQQLPCTLDGTLPTQLQVTADEELSNMITRRQEAECR
ncbi:MAG: hypothetical protein ACPGTU_00780 [Myxococcota bacterium]